MKQYILSVLIAIMLSQPALITLVPLVSKEPSEEIIASREISMEYRYRVPSVSQIFKENILLNVAYMDGRVTSAKDINWDEVNKPFHSEFTLEPNQSFAFHDAVLPEYKDKVVVTTNARFNQQDGFKTDGYLYGDGVCQLASLINWAARDADLEVEQFTNHDFAVIPEVPRVYGVAIYLDPSNQAASARKNLYITNNQSKPVTFNFDYIGDKLTISVTV
jgi:hypothetical protein